LETIVYKFIAPSSSSDVFIVVSFSTLFSRLSHKHIIIYKIISFIHNIIYICTRARTHTHTHTPMNESAHQSPLILMDRRRLLLQATVPPARACLRACCHHTFSLRYFFVRLVSSFSLCVLNALCLFLSVDSSPWSAVRGSPELRAYSSMPRGSVPWPQRNGGGGGVGGAAARVGRPIPTAVRPATKPDDGPAQPAVYVNTVHLVDTCGHVIDMHTVPETTAGTVITDISALQTSGDVDHPGGGGNGSEDDRRKQVATALTGCLSRVQEDLKHIPPGKLILTRWFIFWCLRLTRINSICCAVLIIKCLIATSAKILNLVILVGLKLRT